MSFSCQVIHFSSQLQNSSSAYITYDGEECQPSYLNDIEIRQKSQKWAQTDCCCYFHHYDNNPQIPRIKFFQGFRLKYITYYVGCLLCGISPTGWGMSILYESLFSCCKTHIAISLSWALKGFQYLGTPKECSSWYTRETNSYFFILSMIISCAQWIGTIAVQHHLGGSKVSPCLT